MAGQSGITQHGVQYPSVISQSGELFPEDGESIPYPLGVQNGTGVNWPPSGYTLGTGPTVVAVSMLNSSLPIELDLEWLQGDTAQFSLFIPDVNWATVDPVNTTDGVPTWEEHKWASQVRNPYIFWQNQTNHWVPAYGFQYEWWRQHSGVAEFDIESSLVQADVDPVTGIAFDTPTWGTWLNISLPAWWSERIRPGSWYRWDVQSRSVPTDPHDAIVKTFYRGRVRIVTEWTIE